MNVQSIKQRFGIIGNSPLLDLAIDRALCVAPTHLTVLITGESGSGKEVMPRIIHQNSARKHGEHIAVNCGAIPAGTVDSELFGHEKGSFTGAHEARKGYFEVANGGTIFLDEVGELPLETQARLLRVLETGEYLRGGSSKAQKTNVRVVAATNVEMLDIMFLSMVSAPNDVGAPLSRDTFAQRFNVAASRARDRMYLVRSVGLEHLRPADRLRRSLITHFATPFAQDEMRVEALRTLCESPFEREMYEELTQRGYSVTPQVRVGQYPALTWWLTDITTRGWRWSTTATSTMARTSGPTNATSARPGARGVGVLEVFRVRLHPPA